METFRTELCLGRSQLITNNASTASVREAAFQKIKWW